MLNTEDFAEIYGMGFDDGGLAALRRIDDYRKKHPIRWWLSGGKDYLSILRQVVEESRMKNK